MNEFAPILALLGAALTYVIAVYGLGHIAAISADRLSMPPFTGGLPPVEHAVSRYHLRWYAVTLIFLGFEQEMLVMYPFTRVITLIGTKAVVEMFVFLAVLLAGVAYAWREGAFRWV